MLDLSRYATKKELNDATGVDTSNLAAEINFIALKGELDKLDIDKLISVPIGLNNLKRIVDDLDVEKLKTVSVDLKIEVIFLLKIVFVDDGFQNIFVYQLALNTLELKEDKGTEYVIGWKSERVYNSRLTSLYTAFLHNIKLSGKKFNKSVLVLKQNN